MPSSTILRTACLHGGRHTQEALSTAGGGLHFGGKRIFKRYWPNGACSAGWFQCGCSRPPYARVLQVRAVIVQLGFYTHMLQAVGAAASAPSAASASASGSASLAAAVAATTASAAAASGWQGVLAALTPSVMFVIGFMLFFSIVIALFKVRWVSLRATAPFEYQSITQRWRSSASHAGHS